MSDLSELVRRALAEDVGSGDVTTRAVVSEDARARATIVQKAPGVVFGLDAAEEAFHQLDERLALERRTEEGVWREDGEVLAVEGAAAAILGAERVALNLLGRLSGVATLTARYVRAVEGTGARILDTRKTTPGLRALEKAAVAAGGGHNHRGGLYDAMLVKENHAALAGGVGEAARRALAAAPNGMAVVIECATLEEVDAALAAGATRLLLDNMGPEQLREAVGRARGRAETEASGNVTLETVRSVAESGVDWISVGALTHSAPTLDLSLLLDPLHFV
ncbi:MAG TPA: carboxylating nicotinate-nucleotide diphosphorylase [Solirubrobacteraceae bacterium]|nr:carboxylating nicotinate-nucleotide diphosphorylase [Solirubrobacteraceae bacterium]